MHEEVPELRQKIAILRAHNNDLLSKIQQLNQGGDENGSELSTVTTTGRKHRVMMIMKVFGTSFKDLLM